MKSPARYKSGAQSSTSARINTVWLVAVLICAVVILPNTCFGQKAVESVQEYYTHSKSTAAHLLGASLKEDTICGFRLSANPAPEYCAGRCVSKSLLRISLGCSGIHRRFASPDTAWIVSAQIALIVRTEEGDTIPGLSSTIQLELNSVDEQSIPLTVWQRIATEYSAGSCQSEELIRYDSIQVTVISLDSSGIALIDDSLWLDVEVIEVETVSGLKEGTTLADCSSSGNVMIQPLQVTGVNPITLDDPGLIRGTKV